MKTRSLTSREIEQYHEDGYVLIRSFYSPEEIKLIHETSTEDAVIQQNSYDLLDKHGNKTKLALWYNPGDDLYGMLSRGNRMVNAVEALLGGASGHYHSKVMQKEPKVGGAWEWHQDYGYWYKNGFLFPDMISVLTTLTPATKENGCLQVIKGTHKMGRIGHGLTGEQVGADIERVEKALKIREKVYCEMEPGDVLFFHCNLLHASASNLSDKPRWSIISAYNLLSNKPYNEKSTSCTTPIERVEDDMILKVGKKGLENDTNLLSKKKDTSLLKSK